MSDRFRQFVAGTLLTQVLLVGGVGTGLHGLFGCEHGLSGACNARCCANLASAGSQHEEPDCEFCRRAAAKRAKGSLASTTAASHDSAATSGVVAPIVSLGCDGCAVCDLLAQFHSVTPLKLESHSIELANGEAAILRQNAVIAAAVRLAPSRGPPAV